MEQSNIPGAKMKHKKIVLPGCHVCLIVSLLSFMLFCPIVSPKFLMTSETGALNYELISNSEQCLTDCFMDFTIKIDKNYIMKQSDFLANFKKLSKSTDIYETGFLILINKSYESQKWVYDDPKCDIYKNSCPGKYEIEIRYREIWEELKEKELKTGETYKIRFWGKRLAKIGENKLDAIPVLFGNEIKEWAWWNSTWAKKKPIDITALTNYTIPNYQALLNITYLSGMNQDFSDLRFTNNTQNQELPYWISSKVNGSYANVWVRIDQPAKTTPYRIFMYYENPLAISTSNIANTFIFGDDAEDGDISDWIAEYQTGTCVKSITTLGTTKVLNMTALGSECGWSKGNNEIPTNRSYIMELDVYIRQVFDANYGPKFGSSESTSARYFTSLTLSTNTIESGSVHGGFDGWITIKSGANPTIATGQWYHVKQIRRDSALITNFSYVVGYQNNNAVFQGQITNPAHDVNGSLVINSVRTDNYFDNVILREDIQDLSYSFGSEYGNPLNITIWSPLNLTYLSSPIDLKVSANGTITSWSYNLNGNINSFIPNTTISNATGLINGLNHIIITATSLDTDFTKDIYFTYSVPITPGPNTTTSITFNVDANSDATITRYSCLDNNTLKIDSNIEYCIGESGNFTPNCYWINKTKYQNCEYGCFDGVLENGSYCSPPVYMLWFAGLVILLVSVFLINRFYKGR